MSFAFFCIGNLKGLSHIVHFLHSYTASSKVTGSLQCRGQMPIHNNISACWHRPKVIFFFFFSSVQKGEFAFAEGGASSKQREGRAAQLGARSVGFAQHPLPQLPAAAARAPSAASLPPAKRPRQGHGIFQPFPNVHRRTCLVPQLPASHLGRHPSCSPGSASAHCSFTGGKVGITHASIPSSANLPVAKPRD